MKHFRINTDEYKKELDEAHADSHLKELAVYNQDYDLVGLVKIQNNSVVGSVGVDIAYGTPEQIAVAQIELISGVHVVAGKWGEHREMPDLNGGETYENAKHHDDPWADAKATRKER